MLGYLNLGLFLFGFGVTERSNLAPAITNPAAPAPPPAPADVLQPTQRSNDYSTLSTPPASFDPDARRRQDDDSSQ